MADTGAYDIGQIIFNSAEEYTTGITTYVTDCYDKTSSKYQALVISLKNPNPTGNEENPDPSFSTDKSYYLHLKIPRNQSYDMNYSLRLVGDLDYYGDSTNLFLDNDTSYEFIRFLHVTPSQHSNENDKSQVVLYQLAKKSGDALTFSDDYSVEVAIAKPEPENKQYRNEVYYFGKYDEQNIMRYSYMHGGYTWLAKLNDTGTKYVSAASDTDRLPIAISDIVKKGCSDELKEEILGLVIENRDEDKWYRTKTEYAEWGKNGIILSHSWISNQSEKDFYDVKMIFSPEYSGDGIEFKNIYLYLTPIGEDPDIIWNEGTVSRTGRHISVENLTCELYEIHNVLSGIKNVRRIGIWSHPELMFTINGQELKIGPSGYYELQDFDIKSLGIVATDPTDAFSIDYQTLISS